VSTPPAEGENLRSSLEGVEDGCSQAESEILSICKLWGFAPIGMLEQWNNGFWNNAMWG